MPLDIIPQPYRNIIQTNYSTQIGTNEISNTNLKRYFDEAFNQVIQHYKDYACWVCINCIGNNSISFGWGDKPRRCPRCHSKVYEVATFNSRAPHMGNAFAWSFYHLIETRFNLQIYPTPEGTGTHDFEITRAVAIETKGSPSHIINPNGTQSALNEPGLMRSDTEKKAFANAAKYRQRNPNAFFCIVTNALPDKLLRYSDRDVNAIYDVTKRTQLDLFIRDVRGVIGQ